MLLFFNRIKAHCGSQAPKREVTSVVWNRAAWTLFKNYLFVMHKRKLDERNFFFFLLQQVFHWYFFSILKLCSSSFDTGYNNFLSQNVVFPVKNYQTIKIAYTFVSQFQVCFYWPYLFNFRVTVPPSGRLWKNGLIEDFMPRMLINIDWSKFKIQKPVLRQHWLIFSSIQRCIGRK